MKMTIESITNRNVSEGLHIPIVYINDITNGLFMNVLLFAIWNIVTFGIYFNQKSSSTSGDFPMALAVSGVILAVITTLFRLVDGLVSNVTYSIVLIIALLSFRVLFEDDSK